MTDMQQKRFVGRVKSSSPSGSGQIVVATLGVIDHDGDVTLPGFFGRQNIVLLPSHDWNHVPLGKGIIYEVGNEVVVDYQFNLSIPAAKDWHSAIEFDLANPPSIQEYSYGFRTFKGGRQLGQLDGVDVQFLQPLPDGSPGADVMEVSPVLRGAGLGTRTLSVSKSNREFLAAMALKYGPRAELRDMAIRNAEALRDSLRRPAR